MVQPPASRSKEERPRWIADLPIWLALIVLILVTLFCSWQFALLFNPFQARGNTRSQLDADYHIWTPGTIAVDIDAYVNDFKKESALNGTPTPNETIIVGTIVTPKVPPDTTATATNNPQITSTPGTPIPGTPTATDTSGPTQTTVAPTSTFTLRPTLTVTQTATRQPATPLPPPPPPPPVIPTSTQKPSLPPTFTPTATITATATITPTRTLTPTITITPTITLTPTLTLTPTKTLVPPPPPPPPPATWTPIPTPITPTITPTHAPVLPIAENGDKPDQMPDGGCRVYFGYRNDNASEVDIAAGQPLNWLNDPAAQANPPQPTHFLVGRQFSVFEFTWYSGNKLTWSLDGLTATANWCFP